MNYATNNLSELIHTLHAEDILPAILFPLPAIEGLRLPTFCQRKTQSTPVTHACHIKMFAPAQPIIHLHRDVRFQLTAGNVVSHLHPRTQPEFLFLRIERMLITLTQRKLPACPSPRQGAVHMIAVSELPPFLTPVAVVHLIACPHLQVRQQLILGRHVQPSAVRHAQVVLRSPFQAGRHIQPFTESILYTHLRPSCIVSLLCLSGQGQPTQQTGQQQTGKKSIRYFHCYKFISLQKYALILKTI